MRKNLLLLYAGIFFLVLIPIWIYLIIPEIEKIPSNYYFYEEQLGTNRLAPSVGEPLSEPFIHHNKHSLKAIENNNGKITIESHLMATTDNGFTFLDEKKHYTVDQKSRANIIAEDGFLFFPPGVQKQDYFMTFPLAFTNAIFTFDGVDSRHGIEVYRFNCISEPYDITYAIPQFHGSPVFSYYTCKIWVEPHTGKHIDFELNWESYYEFESKKILVEVGGKKTTNDYVIILASEVYNEKNIYIFYEQILPIIFLLGGVMLLIIHFRNRNLKLYKVEKENIALSKNIKKLEEVDQLKEEFLSMVTHELRTPLTPIMGWCEALKTPKIMGELTKKQADAVDSIYNNSVKLKNLIGDVLDVQKLDLGHLHLHYSSFNVKSLFEKIIKNFNSDGNKKEIKITFDCPNDLEVFTDESRLEQVLTNLVNNSKDFVAPKTGFIHLEAKKDDDKIRFSVKDNGIGISKEHQKHLFKKFYQIDTSITRKHGGTGLGLSICKGLVKLLGGKIWVESEVGKGTTFNFEVKQGRKEDSS